MTCIFRNFGVMLRVGILLLAFLGFVSELFAQGCSQCKLLSEQSSELGEEAFSSSINFGILYLLAIPYILILIFFRKPIISFLKTKLRR